MNDKKNVFNIRVYGLFLRNNRDVLVTDEFQLDQKMTKFPGGGLNFGEGTIECLRREMMEECSQTIDDIQHFYTTDFFQEALFFDRHQLISIYYTAKLMEPLNFRISETPFDFPDLVNGNQSFRWVNIEKLNPEELTFPIDKHVANLLKHFLASK